MLRETECRSSAKEKRGTLAILFRVHASLYIAILVTMLAWLVGSSSAMGQTENSSPERTVRVSVFSLFRPKALRLYVGKDGREEQKGPGELVLEVDGRDRMVPSGAQVLLDLEAGGKVRVEIAASLGGSSWRVDGKTVRAHGGMTRTPDSEFWLEVPGKLRRRFLGTLEVRCHGRQLEAIVTMPLETAVASVVQAESPPAAPLEALKAQAVAARSFFSARQTGHEGFDFCDTTHCQFLRSPPSAKSPAAIATRATSGLILTWHDERSAEDRTLAAMYARSCGGRTRTLREIGVSGNGYPYYSVHCAYCSRHPERWERDAGSAAEDGNADWPRNERERLAFNRIHGWGALPSLAESKDAKQDGKLRGKGAGHGLGLCQLGAADMARHGAGFAEILTHYYPNTKLIEIAAP
jgi:stage II sporulation protein D